MPLNITSYHTYQTTISAFSNLFLENLQKYWRFSNIFGDSPKKLEIFLENVKINWRIFWRTFQTQFQPLISILDPLKFHFQNLRYSKVTAKPSKTDIVNLFLDNISYIKPNILQVILYILFTSKRAFNCSCIKRKFTFWTKKKH